MWSPGRQIKALPHSDRPATPESSPSGRMRMSVRAGSSAAATVRRTCLDEDQCSGPAFTDGDRSVRGRETLCQRPLSALERFSSGPACSRGPPGAGPLWRVWSGVDRQRRRCAGGVATRPPRCAALDPGQSRDPPPLRFRRSSAAAWPAGAPVRHCAPAVRLWTRPRPDWSRAG